MSSKRGKASDPANDGSVDSGGQLPGERPDATPSDAMEVTNPITAAVVAQPQLPKFKQVSLDESKYQRGFRMFREVGEVFHGWFVRCISKNDPQAVGKFDCIEMAAFPDRRSVLLPGNMQLWEFFQDHIADEPERIKHLFQITLTERVMDKEDPEEVKFLRFDIGEEAAN